MQQSTIYPVQPQPTTIPAKGPPPVDYVQLQQPGITKIPYLTNSPQHMSRIIYFYSIVKFRRNKFNI